MTRTIIVQARGLSPLLMHPVTENADRVSMAELPGGIEHLLMFNGAGDLAFPAPWLKHSLHVTHTCTQFGQSQFKQVVKQSVHFKGEWIRLTDAHGQEPEYVEYAHPRHVSKKSRRVVFVRCPQFNEWGFEAEISFEEPSVNERLLQSIFANAGRDKGIGLFSPQYGGKNTFGRFEAVSWRWGSLV
ncbi:MAG: hypothetical protein Q7R93_01585 [bacterium]|nr:hypothetical protein [bacterium]